MQYQNSEDALQKLKIKLSNDPEHIYMIVPNQYSSKISSYISIYNDLLFIIDAANKLIHIHSKNPIPNHLDSDFIYEPGLWYSIIITYGKLFSDASYARRSKLEEKDCFDELDAETNELYKIHKELIELRHAFIAHRGESEADYNLVTVRALKKDLNYLGVHVESVRAYTIGTNVVLGYLKLFNSLISVVEKKRLKNSNKLMELISKDVNILKTFEIIR